MLVVVNSQTVRVSPVVGVVDLPLVVALVAAAPIVALLTDLSGRYG